MKKTYIAQGTIERHENIYTDVLVVNGHLFVKGIIRAKKIYGSGTIEAERIVAHSVVADVLDVNDIVAKKVIANKVFCVSADASYGIIAKDYIEADIVKTTRLTTSISYIDKTEANEIIRLSPKKRSFVATIFCSWLQERFMIWRHDRIAKKAAESAIASEPKPKDPAEREFECVMSAYKEKYTKGGYRLVLEPVGEKAEAV